MGLTLHHLLYALIAGVVAYLVREIRRRRMAVRPRRPEMTIGDAWSLLANETAASPDTLLTSIQASPDARQEAERITRDAETASLGSDNPRLAIRRAILATATTALQLEAIGEHDEEARQALISGYELGMDPLLREAIASSHLAWFVLRVYGRWKFDDAVTDDWFHNYMRMARPYIREKVRLAKEHVMQMDPSAARFAEIYDALLAELQDKMSKAPPKHRFVRPDIP